MNDEYIRFWGLVDQALCDAGEAPASDDDIATWASLAQEDDPALIADVIIHDRDRAAQDSRFNMAYADEMAGDMFRWGDV